MGTGDIGLTSLVAVDLVVAGRSYDLVRVTTLTHPMGELHVFYQGVMKNVMWKKLK